MTTTNPTGLLRRIALVLALATPPLLASEEPRAAAGLDEAFTRLAAFEFGAARETTSDVHDIVLASLGDPERRRHVARRLSGVLASSNATLDAKRFACRELALAGGSEDVAALTPLLFDEDLRDHARLALEAIPDPAAAGALRGALPRLEGASLVAVIDSLGARRDAAAAEALAPLAGSESKPVAAAAAAALGKIGGLAAAGTLGALLDSGAPGLEAAAADAALACAEALAREGRRDAAIALAEKLLESKWPARFRVAAIRALLLASDGRAPGLVLEAASGEDAELARSVLRFVREVPGEDVTLAFANESLLRYAPRAQSAIIEAVGDRGDRAAEKPILDYLASSNPDVRQAALGALARVGGESSALPLARLAAATTGAEEREGARDALDAIRSAGVDAALGRAFAGADGKLRAEIVRALGARRATGEYATLVAALEAAGDENERAEAKAALSLVARRLPDREAAAAPLVAAFERGTRETRVVALRVLGDIGGETAVRTLRAARRSDDSFASEAAASALASCPDPAVRDDLVAMAAEPRHQKIAIEGLVRLAAGTTDERLAALSRALELATAAEAKEAVVRALGTVPDPRAARLVLPLEADPAVAAEAEKAALAIANAVCDSHPAETLDLVTRHLDAPDGRATYRVEWASTLARLERLDDHIGAWLVAGPYRIEGKGAEALFDVPFPPEEALDRAAWRPVGSSAGATKPFEVDLSRALGGEQCAAYLWAEVVSPRDLEARLEIGSDDGVKAWLNGELVHANPAFRGLRASEDRVDVTLREGSNHLLLKVVQGGGGWAACARFRDRDGRHLEGLATRVPNPEPGFVPLFDGASLKGFVVAGREAGFAVRDGAIVSEGGKGGGWLRTARPYGDFELRLEWKVSKNGNSGVFVRAAAEGDPWVTGHEVQITNEPRSDLHCTGSLYGTVAASPRPDEAEDVWHEFAIRCEGTRLTVAVDGVTTVDVDQDEVPAIAGKPLRGYIGLQDSHTGPGGLVAFRNVRVKELAGPAAAQPVPPRVLVFSKTAGFRHDSIADGIAAIRALGAENGFRVEATEDASVFTLANLRRCSAVVFLNTTGDVLDAAQQAAFERFVRRGGGFVGVHSAADTEYEWPFYGELVGAYFKGHPAVQRATVVVEDRVHPSTSHLGATWARTDEWYDYRASPRGRVRVLLSLDESTYSGGTMGGDHPIAWCHRVGEGRAFYTGGGHTRESYSDPVFRRHLLGAIRYVLNR